MRLKDLESLLQDVQPFERPKVELEQYPTGPHLAACMLYTADHNFDDIDGKTVIDLGCGTGMLSIGCALLGASHVLGLEIDEDALRVAQDNVQQFEDQLPVEFVHCNVLSLLPDYHDRIQGEGTQATTGKEDASYKKKGKGSQGNRFERGKGKHGREAKKKPQNYKNVMGTRKQQQQQEGEETDEETEEPTEDEEEVHLLEANDTKETETVSAGVTEARTPGCDDPTAAIASMQINDHQSQQESLGTPSFQHGEPVQPYSIHVDVLSRMSVDTVVLNPPFGTKAWGVDMEFLRLALYLVRPGGSVYSLHKSSTRSYIQTSAIKDMGATTAEVIAELRYNLPATMKFHKHKSIDIEVDLWRIQRQA